MKTMHEATENYMEMTNEAKALMEKQFNKNLLMNMSSDEFESIKILFKALEVSNDLMEAYSNMLIEMNHQLNVLVSLLEEKES